MDGKMSAPVRGRLVLLLLAGIVLVAAVVTGVQVANAHALRGVVDAQACRLTDGAQEDLLPVLERAWVEPEHMLHVEGALLRLDQPVGEVNVRIGLMADGQVILLNTQMVRRPDYAQAYGCDDHCGASALADVRDIGQGTYDVVFVDVQGEETRLITTGMSLCIPVERQADDLLMETEARNE